VQTVRKTSPLLAGSMRPAFAFSLIFASACLAISPPAFAQEAAQGTEPGTVAVEPVVPQQVRYSGKLGTRAGDTVEAVFRIYASAEGGEPLWTETQKLSIGEDGSYSVLLGSADPKGLSQTVFSGGVARWLGVSVERGAESDRVMLASVPYAMKSADAEALAGHAASDFVTQEQLSALALQSSHANQSTSPTPAFSPETSGTVTGSGTTGTIPIWTGTLTQGNSNMVQVGSEIGINESTPAAMLDVNGTEAVRGQLSLPATATATTAKGYPSQTLQFGSSLWSTTAVAPVAQNFSLATIPVGNDTATPSASLLFQYQSGTSAPAGILSIGSTGLISFATGQLFPGTITGAIGTSPLIAGVSGHNITVQLDETAMLATFNATYAQLANSNSFTGSQSIKGGLSLTAGLTAQSSAVTGSSTAVEGFKSNGPVTATPASLATSTAAQNSPQLQLAASAYNSVSAAAVAQTYAWQTQVSGNDTASPSANLALLFGSGTGPAATGLSIASNGRINFAAGQTFPITGTGGGTITGITTTSPLTGSGTTGSVALGLNQSALVTDITPSLESTFNGVYAQLGAANAFTAPQQVNASGVDTSGVDAVVTGNGSIGIYGESDGAVNGSATPIGVEGLATGTEGNGVTADETGPGGYGLYAHASGAYESTGRYAPVGVYALSENGNGVLGISTGSSNIYTSYNAAGYTGGVWADTSAPGTSQSLAGIVASADNNDAAYFVNNSADSTTVFATNQSAGGTGLFKVFEASTRAGTCGIGDGDLSCTGQVKSLVSTGGGARKVETYAPQSAENWMEDYGTGVMERGVSVVKIDPAFAETISETADYHVFITPRADSKGLYVINATAAGFEVRESGGGTSSLTFDYKIVGKRRGYEAQRLIDVTDRFNAESAATMRIKSTGISGSRALRSPARTEPSASAIPPKPSSIHTTAQQPSTLERPN
jgi:hypothetical protein